MNKIEEIYKTMLRVYGKQGWWPRINNKSLLCEYCAGKPKTDEERFEVIVGALLTQGTSWYPGVVRSLQQLKLGRILTEQEQEVLKKAEIIQKEISGKQQKITKNNILTQNTSWSNVEKALGNLRSNDLLNIDSIKRLEIEELAGLIKSSGYNNQKARKLREIIKFLDSNEEISRENLLKVWGVGNETADSILLYAYGKPYFVIDAYTRRIFSRLGFCAEDIDYDKLQELFYSSLKADNKLFNEYHALVVRHAKEFCNKKPECDRCFLKSDCRLAKNLLSKGIS